MKYFFINTEAFQKGEIPEELKKVLEKNPNPFIVLDESSKIKSNKACKKSQKSKRTLAIQSLNKYGHRAILTGTFMSKAPVNAYDQAEFLKENYFDEDMYTFESRYTILIKLPIGRGVRVVIPEDVYNGIHKALVKAHATKNPKIIENAYLALFNRHGITEKKLKHIYEHPEYTPFLDVPEIYKRMGDDIMVVHKEDVKDAPPKSYVLKRVDLPDELAELYDSILKNGYTDELVVEDSMSMYHALQDVCNGYIPYLEGDDEENQTVEIRKASESPKLEALFETIEEIDVARHQIVVWANRKVFLREAYKAVSDLGISSVLYDGSITNIGKLEAKDLFKSGRARIFFCNQASGSYGLDFLQKANYSIYISNDYSAERRHQSEERIYRGEELYNKTIIDIVAKGTIDEKVTRNLKVGIELIKSGKTSTDIFKRF